jgi:hypothetical protein
LSAADEKLHCVYLCVCDFFVWQFVERVAHNLRQRLANFTS